MLRYVATKQPNKQENNGLADRAGVAAGGGGAGGGEGPRGAARRRRRRRRPLPGRAGQGRPARPARRVYRGWVDRWAGGRVGGRV